MDQKENNTNDPRISHFFNRVILVIGIPTGLILLQSFTIAGNVSIVTTLIFAIIKYFRLYIILGIIFILFYPKSDIKTNTKLTRKKKKADKKIHSNIKKDNYKKLDLNDFTHGKHIGKLH